MHLPKTGGRTLVHILHRQYGRDAVLELYDSTRGEELATLAPQRIERLRAAIGHFYFGGHIFAPQPATYVTFLRDPVDRVISHYYFVRTDPSHYLFEVARRVDLREYVIACGPNEPNNDQTRLLAGKRFAADQEARLDEMLSTAKNNLDSHFALVGLTEEFDRSLLLLQRQFGWRQPFYRRQNRTYDRPTKESLPRRTIEVIEAHNELDLALYRFGRELFFEQCGRLGASLGADLRSFRRLNALYGVLRGSFSRVRQVVSWNE